MRTTLDIPDSVFCRAKAQAAQRGIPLRQFITEAVEEKIRAVSKSKEKPWMRRMGQLRHLRKETARINRLIDHEFERIEPQE
jgi:hypothetical protein